MSARSLTREGNLPTPGFRAVRFASMDDGAPAPIPELLLVDEKVAMLGRLIKKIQTEHFAAELVQVANEDDGDKPYRGTTYDDFYKECREALERLRGNYPREWEALMESLAAPGVVDAVAGNSNGNKES